MQVDFHHTYSDTLCLYILPGHAHANTAQSQAATSDGECEKRQQEDGDAGTGDEINEGQARASEGEAAGGGGVVRADKKDDEKRGIDFSYRKCLFGLAERHGIERVEAEALLPFVRKEREMEGAEFREKVDERLGSSARRVGKEMIDDLGVTPARDDDLEEGPHGASMEDKHRKGEDVRGEQKKSDMVTIAMTPP